MRSKDIKKIYNSAKWKKVRLEAMARDNFLCVMCLKDGVETKGDEVDHIIEVRDDILKAFDLDNLQFLCRSHHQQKTKREINKRNLL